MWLSEDFCLSSFHRFGPTSPAAVWRWLLRCSGGRFLQRAAPQRDELERDERRAGEVQRKLVERSMAPKKNKSEKRKKEQRPGQSFVNTWHSLRSF